MKRDKQIEIFHTVNFDSDDKRRPKWGLVQMYFDDKHLRRHGENGDLPDYIKNEQHGIL